MVMVLVLAPVLIDGRPGILDTPITYAACRLEKLAISAQLFDVLGFGNQARPLQFLMFLLVWFGWSVRIYHLFQNGLLMILTFLLLMQIVLRYCQSAWLASVSGCSALLTGSFTCNYFSLCLAEPYMLFGICGLVFVWVRLLGAERVSRGAWWGYKGLGMIFAAYAIGVKEVGVMAFVVCILAAAII